MRKIELKGKVFHSTRRSIDSLAWATQRRGRITWKDSYNVVQKLVEYLDAHRVVVFETDYPGSAIKHLRDCMQKLVDNGYAEVQGGGHRGAFTMFRFKDDVDLTGHEPAFRDPHSKPIERGPGGLSGRRAGRITETRVVETPLTSTPVPTSAPSIVIDDVPLPDLPPPPRWKHEEITRLLDKWADTDADGYADWADRLVTRLGTLLDG